jgi:hypothetical protein
MAEVQIDPQEVIRNLLTEISRLNTEVAILKAAVTAYEGGNEEPSEGE